MIIHSGNCGVLLQHNTQQLLRLNSTTMVRSPLARVGRSR